jgi:transposase
MELDNGVRLGLLHTSLGDDHGVLCRYRRVIGNASLCVVDATGRIVRDAKVASEPEILIGWFRGLGLAVTRIGLEAGPLWQWLYAGMRDAGLPVELLETRHVRDAFKAMPVKTHHRYDGRDARDTHIRTWLGARPGTLAIRRRRPQETDLSCLLSAS